MKGQRRELVAAVLLLVLGAGLLFLVGSRGWVTLSVPRARPLPVLRRTVSGSHAQPLLTALGVLGLAGVVALLATRNVGRQIVGLVLAAVAVVATVWLVGDLHGMSASRAESLLAGAGPVVGVAAGARVRAELHLAWVAVAMLGVVLLIVVGLAAAVRGRGWPVMGSRYDRPQRTPAGDPAHEDPDAASGEAVRRRSAAAERRLWEALDRGEDPTASGSTE